MVTTVIIPAVRRMKSADEQMETFEEIEGRFSLQAKITTLLTGISGFYMMYRLNAWHRYLELKYWWITSMTLVWVLFTLILFVFEPLVMHKLFKTYGRKHPGKMFRMLHRMHWVLLILSLLTIAGAVAGCHGWLL